MTNNMKKICRNCKQPDYKCSCGETDLVDAAFAVAEGIIEAEIISSLFDSFTSSSDSSSSSSDSSSGFDGFGGGDFGGGGADGSW